MAKRTRKQKERALLRRPGVGASLPAGADLSDVADEAAANDLPGTSGMGPAAPVPGARRRVERVGAVPAGVTLASVAPPARARLQRHQPTGYIAPLESEDPAIPFDRVPYVPADLRRVAIIATIMVALIIVADIIVSNVVK